MFDEFLHRGVELVRVLGHHALHRGEKEYVGARVIAQVVDVLD